MKELASAEHLVNVDPTEAMHWAFKIGRVTTMALAYSPEAIRGGQGNDVMQVIGMSEQVAPEDWPADPMYDEVSIWSFKQGGVTYERVAHALHGPEPVDQKTNELTRQAFLSGLHRLGLIERTRRKDAEFTVPLPVVAGLCLQRGDIAQLSDRLIYGAVSSKYYKKPQDYTMPIVESYGPVDWWKAVKQDFKLLNRYEEEISDAYPSF